MLKTITKLPEDLSSMQPFIDELENAVLDELATQLNINREDALAMLEVDPDFLEVYKDIRGRALVAFCKELKLQRTD